ASSHEEFKKAVVNAHEGDTVLTLKKLTPVRLIKNHFYNQVLEAENNCMTESELANLLGRARAKKGMFEGDMNEGELEIGQVSAILNDIKPAADIVNEVWKEFCTVAENPFAY